MTPEPYVEAAALVSGWPAVLVERALERVYGPYLEGVPEPGRTEALRQREAIRRAARAHEERARHERNARTQGTRAQAAACSTHHDRHLNAKQVGDVLGGLTPARVHQLAVEGRFGHKVGGRWHFEAAEVQAYLDAKAAS